MNNVTIGGAVAIGGILTAFMVTILIIYLFLIIAGWRIFKKAGEPGWKILIPIYNVYIMYKIVRMKTWFWYLIMISVFCSIVFLVYGYNPYTMTAEQIANYDYVKNTGVLIMIVFYAIVNITASIIYAYRLSKVFGHGIGYTIGILFLPEIFWLILGYGSDKYDKKRLTKKN